MKEREWEMGINGAPWKGGTHLVHQGLETRIAALHEIMNRPLIGGNLAAEIS